MTRAASRHRLYYDLLDAFRQEGCPICRLGKLTVARYLDILAYENVNDPGVREKLRAARGFCNYHAYQFLEEVRDLLAAGIIYRDVVNAVVLALPAGDSPALTRQVLSIVRPGPEEPGEDHGLAGLVTPGAPCPACQALDQGVTDRLHGFLEHLPEADFRAAYQDSDGLCHPHFLEAVAQVREQPQLELLVRSEDALLAREAASASGARPGVGRDVAYYGRRSLLKVVISSFGDRGAIARANRPGRAFGRTTHAGPSPQGERAQPSADPDICPACARAQLPTALATETFAQDLSAGGERGTELLDLLCNRHAWQLAQAVPTGGLRPLFAAVAERRRSRLAALVPPLLAQENGHGGLELPGRLPRARRLGMELARQLEPRGTCPLCERQAAIELGELRRYLAESEKPGLGDGAAEEMATLCLPHLSLSCRLRLSSAGRAALVRRQVLGWSALIEELKEYIRKQDYRFRDEPRGHEQTSPYRAVAQMAGRKDLR